jgi:transmembrane sensor
VLRYAGKSDEAEFAYALLRRKFGGSHEAKLGAYSLAKVAFDQRGDYATASRWLYIYLDEAPEGSLAREALGRLMNAEHRLGRVAEARALARRYLSAHPTGPGAAQARQLLSE